MGRWLGPLVAGVTLVVWGVADAQPARGGQGGPRRVEIPETVDVQYGVVYGTGGGRELKLDLFVPKEGAEPRPGVVFIHGGGWRGGSPGQFHPQAAHLAGLGYVCASIEYRFSDEAPFPAALEDAKCAMRWMRANAAELKLDPSRLAVSGGSAGGHLAAMIATTGPGPFEGQGGHAEQSSAANLAICFNPVLDLTTMGEALLNHPMLTAFLGASYAEDPDRYVQASPITYVSGDDPPMLILHGTEDTTVPYAQAEAMVRKVTEAGVEAELFAAEGAGHAFFNGPPWYEPTLQRMTEFLAEHFPGGLAQGG